jgi:hypothetical protein
MLGEDAPAHTVACLNHGNAQAGNRQRAAGGKPCYAGAEDRNVVIQFQSPVRSQPPTPMLRRGRQMRASSGRDTGAM